MTRFEREAASKRQRIRNIFGVSNNVPIVIEKGEGYSPFKVGRSGGHFTKGGTRISHPGAYAKKGWSNMQYLRSTVMIYVGEYFTP